MEKCGKIEENYGETWENQVKSSNKFIKTQSRTMPFWCPCLNQQVQCYGYPNRMQYVVLERYPAPVDMDQRNLSLYYNTSFA